jgi:hypothetical protein
MSLQKVWRSGSRVELGILSSSLGLPDPSASACSSSSSPNERSVVTSKKRRVQSGSGWHTNPHVFALGPVIRRTRAVAFSGSYPV